MLKTLQLTKLAKNIFQSVNEEMNKQINKEMLK